MRNGTGFRGSPQDFAGSFGGRRSASRRPTFRGIPLILSFKHTHQLKICGEVGKGLPIHRGFRVGQGVTVVRQVLESVDGALRNLLFRTFPGTSPPLPAASIQSGDFSAFHFPRRYRVDRGAAVVIGNDQEGGRRVGRPPSREHSAGHFSDRLQEEIRRNCGVSCNRRYDSRVSVINRCPSSTSIFRSIRLIFAQGAPPPTVPWQDGSL